MTMEQRNWIPCEIILRGLSGSCISACTLRKWWFERQEHFRHGHWDTNDFESEIYAMQSAGLVEMQRRVFCHVCGRRNEAGWALTAAGYAAERAGG